jgi:hypothetical protein
MKLFSIYKDIIFVVTFWACSFQFSGCAGRGNTGQYSIYGRRSGAETKNFPGCSLNWIEYLSGLKPINLSV